MSTQQQQPSGGKEVKSTQPVDSKPTSESTSEGKNKETMLQLRVRLGLRLETPWTFYFSRRPENPTNKTDYENNIVKLGRFETLEGFWNHYVYIQRPQSLPSGHNLMMFRHNWTPAWETFPNGGCWIIKVRVSNRTINRLWEELLFACVGENFAEPDVVGVMISRRQRSDYLSIWNRDNSNKSVRPRVGEKLRAILNLNDRTVVQYKEFAKAIEDGSTHKNAKRYMYKPQMVNNNNNNNNQSGFNGSQPNSPVQSPQQKPTNAWAR